VEKFNKNATDNDQRCGVLSFGFRTANWQPIPEDGENNGGK